MRNADMPGMASARGSEQRCLLRLQQQALQYFLDNQTSAGLILDRQSNQGPLRDSALCSTAATGMGWIALALATDDPYRMLSHDEAVLRIRTGINTALTDLPHDHGVVPHFFDVRTGKVFGNDYFSTIETAWLTAGALWTAAFLHDAELERLAHALWERIDWQYWTAPAVSRSPLIRHGQTSDGQFLPCVWDRLNGETVFMYVMATGASGEHALPREAWAHLAAFYGQAAGRRFNNSALGLFVFQYGLDLLDLHDCLPPSGVDLAKEAAIAAEANYLVCRDLADTFTTYRDYWGLSAGDGPALTSAAFAYRCYAPGGPIDGTAHLTASVASFAQQPDLVRENLDRAAAEHRFSPLGRYGFSNINVDFNWLGPDMVGIDAGALVLALDNYLHGNRVRNVFHRLECVRCGLERAPFRSPQMLPARAA